MRLAQGGVLGLELCDGELALLVKVLHLRPHVRYQQRCLLGNVLDLLALLLVATLELEDDRDQCLVAHGR